jgi:hypothetical protein
VAITLILVFNIKDNIIILLIVALNTTNLAYKHFTLTRPIHVPMDICIVAWDMYTNVMMFNWFPKDNTDIHDGLNTLSFTIVSVSSEQRSR